ncbi:DUF3179 domain-containing protein [Bauldia sp.]|uniref:DUF3179 domain-containing protein n=1 Tax=Bauldia sp. TaxID=2575872 RepID=UPI003BA9192C
MSRSMLAIGAAAIVASGAIYFVASGDDPTVPVGTTADSSGLSLVQSAEAAEDVANNPMVSRWQREGWQTDFTKTTINFDEILSGGPPRDGIPSIDAPKFVAVGSDEVDLVDREPVISLEVNGEAKAYPLRVMMWHEIANDSIGGMPVTVTYCPLCNAAIVFDATVEGQTLEFGTTGKLRNSDLVMYDRSTESWWQQFSGEAIAGDFVGSELKMLPSRLDSWGRFKAEHPEGQVLVPNNEQMRAYWRNPYTSYDSAAAPFLYNGVLPEGIRALERVVLVRDEGAEPFAIALPVLEKEKEVREGNVVVTWEPGQASALDTSRISEGRDVGNVSVFRDGTDEPVVHDVTFAFVVAAFEPTLTIRTE